MNPSGRGMSCRYRCYFLSRDNKVKDVIEFTCDDDATAVVEAWHRFRRLRIFSGFELWEGARRVYVQLRRPDRDPV